jgi:uncharacterized iron-regulated protein
VRKSTKTRISAAVIGFVAVGAVITVLSAIGAVAGPGSGEEAPIVVDRRNSATLPQVMTELRDERLVYVGETHTAYADHLVQLGVLEAMAAQARPLAVGVEWFQARFQPVIDDYFAGRIDEGEFLRRTEYYDRWRFDYRLYRPIVEFARANEIPLVALNAAREVTEEISRVGLDAVSGPLKAELPDAYDFSDKAYEDRLRSFFEMHPGGGEFDRFLEVQLTWDESMAMRVADWLQANPDGRMLVLAGKGHINGRSGIPDRVTRRVGLRGVVLSTYSESGGAANDADYLVLAQAQDLAPAGLMRVFLDESEDGVYVRDFSPDSPAASAGVRKNDRLASIDGQPIRFFADVKVQMLDKRPGEEIEVRLIRETPVLGSETVVARFKLAGESPAPSAG